MLPLLAQGSPESDNIHAYLASINPHPPKPSRKQVSRACGQCRIRRVKCDHGRPCRPCRQRGLECNSRGSHNDEARTLPQALKEIERLRSRIEELEAELAEERRLRGGNAPSQPQPASLTPVSTSTSPASLPLLTQPGTGVDESGPKKIIWEGIFTATARSEQTSYYGPSSAFYFIGRIGSFLKQSLHQSFADRSMQPKGANRTLASPTGANDASTPTARREDAPRPAMSRVQEEYFLNLFWESHHANMPILAEDEFRKHYNSLWQDSKTNRKPSALADIIIAISMQYGWVFLFPDTPASSSPSRYDDASIAGRWYYRRCQTLLAADLESPSITTLQCHLYTAVYLCAASFQNMSHTTLAIAVRTAQILGLHLEPPETMPAAERELRKRLWAVVYNLEVKICMKLGRPFALSAADITVGPPADNAQAAALFGSSLAPFDGQVTWLTYLDQVGKLLKLSVDIYTQLYAKWNAVLGQAGPHAFTKDPAGFETCAQFLTTLVNPVQAWAAQVPPGLRLPRRDNGSPLSLDRSALQLDGSAAAPLWLQRHRVCLELMYHSLSSNLYRPFISFSSSGGTGASPTAERLAAACVAHAVAHTHILHQVLRETDLMNGWQEFFLWQWNAAVNIIGFILAYPVHPTTPSARRAVDRAVEIFEVYGANFAVAASAAVLTRELVDKADALRERLRSGIAAGACSPCKAQEEDLADPGPDSGVAGDGAEGGFGAMDCSPQTGSSFSEFMDWALTVDSFNSFEDLFADANMGMDWWAAPSSARRQ